MKKIFLSLLCLVMALGSNAKDHEGIVTEYITPDGFALIVKSKPLPIVVADNDKKGVLIASKTNEIIFFILLKITN